MSDKQKPGPTGEYPLGKLEAGDEGELKVAIAADPRNGVVRVEFGTTVGWLAMPPSGARSLAAMLIEKADELEKGAH